MRAWLQRLVTRRQPLLEALPLGDSGQELPWHTSLGEARRMLASIGGLSLEIDGRPTARLKFGSMTLRATLEFEEGLPVKRTWLPKVPGAHLLLADGRSISAQQHLRGATLHFPVKDPRKNWKWTLKRLGKPEHRAADGSWEWRGKETTVRYFEAEHDGTECLRLETTRQARLLEIVNRSTFELYRALRVKVDFRDAAWETAEAPPAKGVITRLHWYVPEGYRMVVTATVGDASVHADVYARARQVVITPDGAGGVRIVS
jgi:hypothetical protein